MNGELAGGEGEKIVWRKMGYQKNNEEKTRSGLLWRMIHSVMHNIGCITAILCMSHQK